MTITTDLLTLRNILASRGRAVGRGSTPDGKLCLGVAIDQATGFPDGQDRREALVNSLFGLIRPNRNTSDMRLKRSVLMLFNDSRNTSDSDVFNVIDKALAGEGAV